MFFIEFFVCFQFGFTLGNLALPFLLNFKDLLFSEMQKLKCCCRAWLKSVKELWLWQMKYFDTVFNDNICSDDVTVLWMTLSGSAGSFYLEPAVLVQIPCRFWMREFRNCIVCQASPTWILLSHFSVCSGITIWNRLRFKCLFFAKWHLTYLIFKA